MENALIIALLGLVMGLVTAIPETLISSTILLLHSSLSWQLPIAMFAGSFVGAWIGSHLAVRHGDVFIKKFMVTIALLMIIKVALDIYTSY